jgi:hypothetical protein
MCSVDVPLAVTEHPIMLSFMIDGQSLATHEMPVSLTPLRPRSWWGEGAIARRLRRRTRCGEGDARERALSATERKRERVALVQR